ncbi:MAG TPA: hypothetical protein VMH26_17270 [Burkholderiales bacterium]|nr:hypothetical protein [Burkholderiales bacterium]
MQTRVFVLCLAFCGGAVLGGCDYIAEQTAPAKRAAASRTDASIKADALFWQVLHAGQYEQIPTVLQSLTAAYLANPTDAVTAAHVGWMHIWQLSESARLDPVPAMITDDAILARRYFQEAVNLNPHEARYLGFLAATTLAEGSIHKDEKITRRGYYLMLDAIDAWPEFNLFTAGYVASGQPADSKPFKQALQWEWRDLDVCVNAQVDRANPTFVKYMAMETTEGPKRACWNSWIAPHNFEGFFLNMGDMLVKAGDWQTAQKIYADAKLSATYAQWKFRDVLEERIAQAQGNVAVFNGPAPGAGRSRQRMMAASPFACVACHQQ